MDDDGRCRGKHLTISLALDYRASLAKNNYVMHRDIFECLNLSHAYQLPNVSRRSRWSC